MSPSITTVPVSSASGLTARPSAAAIAATPLALGLTSATRSLPSARAGSGGLPATNTFVTPHSLASRASAKLSSFEATADSTMAMLAGGLREVRRGSRVAVTFTARSQPAGRPSTVAAASRCSRRSWYVNRPSSHIQYWLTSALWRGTRRHARPCLWWISTLQPVAQPLHTLGVASSSHARIVNRKSLAVSAPTGQTSTVLSEYALSSSAPGAVPSTSWSPRWLNSSWCWPPTSSQTRMQREHRMQRSWSSTIVGPRSTTFCL